MIELKIKREKGSRKRSVIIRKENRRKGKVITGQRKAIEKAAWCSSGLKINWNLWS